MAMIPAARIKCWTRAEYERLADLGMFQPDERLELLDGQLVYKAGLYARAGIPEYWIVDVLHAAVEVHRQPAASEMAPIGGRYGDVVVRRPPAAVAALIAPDSAILVADLLP